MSDEVYPFHVFTFHTFSMKKIKSKKIWIRQYPLGAAKANEEVSGVLCL